MTFVASLVLGTATVTFALEGGAKPELEALMKQNGKAYTVIEKGIAKGKFEGLPEQAQGIVDRFNAIAKDYEPPILKEKTLAFHALAGQLAGQAQQLKEGLVKGDPTESKQLLKTMEKTCISCHQMFVPKKKKK